MGNRLYSIIPALCLVAAGAGLLLIRYSSGFLSTPSSHVKTVTLQAEKGRFIRGENKNPTISTTAGTRLKIRFKNTDRGTKHEITVPAKMDRVHQVKYGQTATLAVQFDRPGTYEYTCPRHPFMKGIIHVSSDS